MKKFFTIESFFKLSEEEKGELCQELNPYEESEWKIFKEVEQKFINEFGNHEAITSVFCGLAPMTGPFNSINVRVKKGKKRLILPKNYQGFPILRSYDRKKKLI